MVPTWSKRKSLVMGLCTIATGLAIGRDALESRRTGVPITVAVDRSFTMDWWMWLGVAALIVALGLYVIAVGFGLLKLRQPKW